MPTPPISDKTLKDVLRNINNIEEEGYQHGGSPSPIQVYAKRIGSVAKTIRGRVAMAKQRGITYESVREEDEAIAKENDVERLISSPDFPDFPEGDVSIDILLDQLESRSTKRFELDHALDWFTIKVPETKPFGLVFVGDPHLDDNGCNWKLLRRDVEIMKQPGIYAINQGDTTNNWVGRLQRLYAHQDTSIETAHRLIKWFLFDAGINWILWLLGNHDLWGDGHLYHDAMKTGTKLQSLPMVEWGARFQIQGKVGRPFRLWSNHDFPGHSMYNPLHGPLKKAMFSGAWVDALIAGHKHIWALMRVELEDHDVCPWLLRARGYKFMDSHARKLGMFEMQEGASVMGICEPENGRIRFYEDIEEASEILAFKRAKK
jgi:hypothetical protein